MSWSWVDLLHKVAGIKQELLIERSGLCMGWPNRISPIPTLNTQKVPEMLRSCVWWLCICCSLGLESSFLLGTLQLSSDFPLMEPSQTLGYLFLLPCYSLYYVSFSIKTAVFLQLGVL